MAAAMLASGCTGDDDDDSDLPPGDDASLEEAFESALLAPDDIAENWIYPGGGRQPSANTYAGELDVLASATTQILEQPMGVARPPDRVIPDISHAILLYPDGEQASAALAERLDAGRAGTEPFAGLGERAVGGTFRGDDGRLSGAVIIRMEDALSVLVFRRLSAEVLQVATTIADERLRELPPELVQGETVVAEPATTSPAAEKGRIGGVDPEDVVEKLEEAGLTCDGPAPDLNLENKPIMSWLCARPAGEDSAEVKVVASADGLLELVGIEALVGFESADDPEQAAESFFVSLVDLDYEFLTPEEAIAFVRRNLDTGGTQEIGGVRFSFTGLESHAGRLSVRANRATMFDSGQRRTN